MQELTTCSQSQRTVQSMAAELPELAPGWQAWDVAPPISLQRESFIAVAGSLASCVLHVSSCTFYGGCDIGFTVQLETRGVISVSSWRPGVFDQCYFRRIPYTGLRITNEEVRRIQSSLLLERVNQTTTTTTRRLFVHSRYPRRLITGRAERPSAVAD